MDSQPIVWKASAAEVARSRTAEFMARHGIDTYQELVARSTADLEWFWEAAIDYLGVPFSKPYHTLVDTGNGIQFPRWFSGGQINLSEVCVDRWAALDPDRTALVAEREDGSQRIYSFGELLDTVERAAGALIEAGAGKGDTVTVYLPMTAEAVVTRKTDPRKRYISMPPWSHSALSCAKASPAPELSFTPTTVPSPASAAIVCGSTTVLTVTGML